MDRAARHYAAIVESSDDAILSKTIDGVILSWNAGAERLLGFSAKEAVGQPSTIVVPVERRDEESGTLEAIRRGESRRFETVRSCKDGNVVDVSITASPIREANGRIVGASTIARDIREVRKARERQQLLLREMNHRVKSLFALTASIVALSARSANTPQQMVTSVRARLAALARAHTLMFSDDGAAAQPRTLHALIRTIVAPFDEPREPRLAIRGVDAPISGGAVSALALLLQEFATNAAKYGALSADEGKIAIDCSETGDNIVITWTERGGPPVSVPGGKEGFGGLLSRLIVASQLAGEITRNWEPEGLLIRLATPKSLLVV